MLQVGICLENPRGEFGIDPHVDTGLTQRPGPLALDETVGLVARKNRARKSVAENQLRTAFGFAAALRAGLHRGVDRRAVQIGPRRQGLADGLLFGVVRR